MKKEFIYPNMEIVLLTQDIIKTSNEAYVSWWEEDQPEQNQNMEEGN